MDVTMINLPFPPTAIDPIVWNSMAAGAIVIGALLLLWGRTLGRAFLTLAGAGVGAALGQPTAEAIKLDPLITVIVAAIVLAILFLLLARVVWGLLALAVLGGVALAVGLARLPPDPAQAVAFKGGDSYQAYLLSSFNYVGGMLQYFLKSHPRALVICAAAGGVALLIALVRPRLGVVFMSCLVGGGLVTGGLAGALWKLNESILDVLVSRPYVPAAIVGLLMILGIVHQYRSAIAAERQEREAEPPGDKAEKPDKGESKKAKKAEKE